MVNQSHKCEVVSVLLSLIVLTAVAPAAAQHWSFDARWIALGGSGSGTNISSGMVLRRQSSLQGLFLQAIRDGDAGRVQRLLDAGVRPGATLSNTDGTLTLPLLEAIRSGHADVAEILLCAGARAESSFTGRLRATTPLAEARRSQDEEMIDIIIDAIERQRNGRPCE